MNTTGKDMQTSEIKRKRAPKMPKKHKKKSPKNNPARHQVVKKKLPQIIILSPDTPSSTDLPQEDAGNKNEEGKASQQESSIFLNESSRSAKNDKVNRIFEE